MKVVLEVFNCGLKIIYMGLYPVICIIFNVAEEWGPCSVDCILNIRTQYVHFLRWWASSIWLKYSWQWVCPLVWWMVTLESPLVSHAAPWCAAISAVVSGDAAIFVFFCVGTTFIWTLLGPHIFYRRCGVMAVALWECYRLDLWWWFWLQSCVRGTWIQLMCCTISVPLISN